MTNIHREVETAIIAATGLAPSVATRAAADHVVGCLTTSGIVPPAPDKAKTVDRFLARVAAEDPTAVAIATVVEECGLTIGSRGGKNGTRRVAAMKTLEAIYLALGKSALKYTLNILHNAFGDEGLDRNMIAAMSEVLGAFGEKVDTGHLAQTLRAATYSAIRQEANGRFYANGRRWRSSAIAETIVALYNTGPVPHLTPGLIISLRYQEEDPLTWANTQSAQHHMEGSPT